MTALIVIIYLAGLITSYISGRRLMRKRYNKYTLADKIVNIALCLSSWVYMIVIIVEQIDFNRQAKW